MHTRKLNLSMIQKKYGIVVGIVISLLICICIYYTMIISNKKVQNKAFVEGEYLYVNKEYDKAIEKYREYLADKATLSDSKRWLVWQRLLYITVQLKSDLAQGISILREMEKEYAYDVQYMPQVLKEMVQVYHMQRSKEEVIQTLEKLVTSEFPLSQEEKVKLYRQYAILIAEDTRNLQRGEEQLERCVQKEKGSVVKWCQYELGVIYTLGEQYKKARPIFHSLIANSLPEEEIHYSSRFMLATIYGFLGEKKQAIEEFKAIEDIYPNKDAIRSRVKALSKPEKNIL